MTKILVIDDEKLIRERMQKLLELDDYETVSAGDGPTGLELLEKEKPEVALIDIKMPGMDGIEVLRRVKEKTTDTEVIMITGHGGIETAIDALKINAFGYIQKPVDYDELELEIKRALEKQKLQKRLNEHVRTVESAYSELDQIFNSAADGMWVIDRDFNVLRTNRVFDALSGVNANEAVGKKCYEIFAGPSCHTSNCSMVRILGGAKCVEADLEKERKDGTKRSYSLTTVPFVTPGGELVGTIENIRDITERQHAVEAIKEARDELEQRVQDRTAELSLSNEELKLQSEIASNMAEGVYLTSVSDHKIIYTNPRFDEMFGYGPGEMIGRDASIVNAPSDMSPQETVDHIEGILRQFGVWRGEIQNIKKDGTPFWSYASASIYKHHDYGKTVVSVHTDITERKRAEEMVRESEEKYRILFEQANMAIFVAQDGMIKSPNPKALDLHGYSEEEFTSKPFIDFIHPEDQEMVHSHERRLRGEELPSVYCYRIINKAGDTKWVELNVVPLLWEGRPATLCFMNDITNQRQAEEERRTLETQLQQSQKMEAIGTLSGGIAHDFNNILGVIIGNTELAMMDIPRWNQAHDNLQEIHKVSLRAADMVKQILAFSRKGDTEFVPLEIGAIIKDSIKMLRFSIPKTIEIIHNRSGKINPLNGNPTQIHQILINLCTNAAYAMRENGGRLEIGVDNTVLDEDAASRFPGLASGKYVKLTVSDTGKGMDPGVIDRIFDPYFTTKGVGEGTGMGLSVIHGIVKNHGGAITVHSEPEKGSTFDVLFPSIEGHTEPERMTTHTLPKGDAKILLIDDEPAMVKMVQSMLERLGYTISVRTSSIEALEAFKARPDKYDLVITDQTMPHLTGQMLAREMMTIRPALPIILCTGHSDLINGEEAKEMGIRAFAKKPLLMAEIAEIIRSVLNSQSSTSSARSTG